jgi:hypothetical protein
MTRRQVRIYPCLSWAETHVPSVKNNGSRAPSERKQAFLAKNLGNFHITWARRASTSGHGWPDDSLLGRMPLSRCSMSFMDTWPPWPLAGFHGQLRPAAATFGLARRAATSGHGWPDDLLLGRMPLDPCSISFVDSWPLWPLEALHGQHRPGAAERKSTHLKTIN